MLIGSNASGHFLRAKGEKEMPDWLHSTRLSRFLSFGLQLQQFNICSYLPVGLQIVLYNFFHISIKKQTLMSEIIGDPLLQMLTKQQNCLNMDI